MAKPKHTLRSAKVMANRKDGKNQEPIGQLTVEDIEWEVDGSVIAAINDDMQGAYRNIQNDALGQNIRASKIKHIVVEDVALGTAEVPVRHNFGHAPLFYHVTLQASSNWYESKEPDAMNVYIRATSNVTANVFIQG